jgi:hypothetical protein
MKVGFTAILLGYLLVWLPHDVAGLSFIGVEMGEWVKFLPQIRSGEIAANRNLFYVPPITLGLMLAFWTTYWPNIRWQTWAMRLLAVIVALLAFPAVEAILDEGTSEWLARVAMIAVVAVVTILVSLLSRLPQETGLAIGRIAMIILALVGLTLPMWAYLAVRPVAAKLLTSEIGIGPGLWFNVIGNLMVLVAVSFLLFRQRITSRDRAGN